MNKHRLAILCFLVLLALPDAGLTQEVGAPAVATGSNSSPEQLDQLVAPVALYPDPLLADVLTAATDPLEVVDADHWAADPQNSGISGDELTDALKSRGWDPSVQSLAPFPQVLQVMDSHLDWMEALGEAFLAQTSDVMDAVQRMRARARSAGNLPTNGEEAVTDQNAMFAISPPSDLIYVPEYDPWCAFGDWPYPVASPFYFSNWSGNCDPADYGVVFDPGIAWPFSFWSWGYFDWHGHRVLLRPDMYRQFHPDRQPKGVVWEYDPKHRDGVFYRNTRNIRAFGQPATQRASSQVWTNPVNAVRPAPTVGNWNSVRAIRVPSRPALPAAGRNRARFGQPAPGVGKAHASRTPDGH